MKGRAPSEYGTHIRFGTTIAQKHYQVNIEKLKKYLNYFMFDPTMWNDVCVYGGEGITTRKASILVNSSSYNNIFWKMILETQTYHNSWYFFVV